MHLRRIRILTLLERIHPVPAPTETVLTESIVLLPCASVLCGCSSIDRSVVLVRPSSSSSSSPRVAARPGFTWASSPTCSTGSRESASPSPWTHPCGRTRGTRWRQRVSSTQPSHTEQAHPPSRTSTELTSPSALVPVHPSPFSSARCPSRSPAADPGVAGDPPSAVRPREPALEDPPGVSTPSAGSPFTLRLIPLTLASLRHRSRTTRAQPLSGTRPRSCTCAVSSRAELGRHSRAQRRLRRRTHPPRRSCQRREDGSRPCQGSQEDRQERTGHRLSNSNSNSSSNNSSKESASSEHPRAQNQRLSQTRSPPPSAANTLPRPLARPHSLHSARARPSCPPCSPPRLLPSLPRQPAPPLGQRPLPSPPTLRRRRRDMRPSRWPSASRLSC